MISLIDRKTIKFIFVGILNTLVGTGVMFFSYNILGLGYWISSALNYIIGSILSYFLNKYFTFKSKRNGIGSILRFVINISLCYFIAYGIAKPVVAHILSGYSYVIRDNISMLFGMGLFVVLNYIGQRYIVFKD